MTFRAAKQQIALSLQEKKREKARKALSVELDGGRNGKGTCFYYAFWAIMLFAKALNLSASDRLLQLCMLAALGCLALKYLFTDWTARGALVGWCLCALGVLTFLKSGSTELLITLAALVGAKDVKLKPLVKFIFGLRLVIFCATILMATTGIVENVSEFTEDFDGNLLKGQRFYLGFVHPNFAQVSLFVLIGLYAWINFKKLNIIHFGVFLALNFLLYQYTMSRTGMMLICLLCFCLALFRQESLFKGSALFTAVPVFFALFCLFIGVMYNRDVSPNAPLVKLNDMLSGRIFLIFHFLRFGVTAFGAEVVTDSVYVLDCAYTMLLKQYGFVSFLLFVCLGTIVLVKLYRKRCAGALLFAGMFWVLGFFEHFAIDVFVNPTLLLFAPLLFGTKTEREEQPAFAKPVLPGQKRTLAGNFLYYLTYTLLQVVIPLVTIVYVSKILGADGVGKASVAQNFASYFTIIASLGIPNYGTRELSKAKTREERDRLFTELFSINFISTTICLVAYLLAVLSFGYFAELKSLYLVAGLAIALNYCNVDWLYRGTEEYPFMTESSLIVKAAAFIGLLLFVTKPQDVAPYLLLATIALTGSGVLNLIYARKFVSFRFKGISLRRHLKPVFVLLAANVAIELYTLLDITMLGIFCTDAEVGYYTNAMKLVKTTVTVICTIGAILLPRLSVSFQSDRKTSDQMVQKAFFVLLLICLPATLGIFFLSDSIILGLFGAEYFPSVPIMVVLAPLILIMGIGNLFGTQVLLSSGAERKLFYSVLLGAASNMALNAFLIPAFGGRGAALASVVSELLVMTAQVVFAMKYCSLRLSPAECAKPVLATIGMCLALVLVRFLVSSALVEVVVGIFVGVLVYFGICLALRQRECLEGAVMLRDKLSLLLSKRKGKAE